MLFDDRTATYCMMVSTVTAELLIQGKGLFKSYYIYRPNFLFEGEKAGMFGLIILGTH